MRCVIVDLDATLSDPTHRLNHIEGEEKNWPAFFAAMGDDPVIPAIATLVEMIRAASYEMTEDPVAVVIVTARPDENDYRQITESWLNLHHIRYEALYMRAGGDFRPDYIVKAEILQALLDEGYEPLLAIDDRPEVVRMWRDYGITTLQCQPDEPRRSRYAGQTLLHMLVGPVCAGKSTYCDKNYKPHDVISADEIRRQLFGDHERGQSPDDLARTWRYIRGLIAARLDVGVFTVLDATNVKAKDRAAILGIVPQGIMVRYVVLDRDLGDKLKERDWRSEELVLKYHRTFKAELPNILAGDEHPYVTVQDKR